MMKVMRTGAAEISYAITFDQDPRTLEERDTKPLYLGKGQQSVPIDPRALDGSLFPKWCPGDEKGCLEFWHNSIVSA